MSPAALRILAAAFVIGAAADARLSAADAARSTPLRPGGAAAAAAPTTSPAAASLRTRKIAGVDYVSAADVAAQLGLKLTTAERGRKAILSDRSLRAELEKDDREITVNGLRVFLGEPVFDAGGQLYVSRIDFERSLTPLLRPGQGVPPQPAPKTIVLDPGHGGKDNGTSAQEKTYALDVARRAKKILEAAGHRVVLTRDADVFLDLPQRGALANGSRADVFASIHFNALPNDTKTSGVEIFTFAPQSQRSTNSWSPRVADDTEKESAPVNRYDHWSVVLAHAIHRRFVVDLKSFDRGKKLAHWGVLRGLNCPGVLIECGFLTSEAEARKIATPQHRQKLAEAIAAGIRDYAAKVGGSRPLSATVAQTNAQTTAGLR